MTCANVGERNLGANVIEYSERLCVERGAESKGEPRRGSCIHQIKELERSTTTSEELVRDTR